MASDAHAEATFHIELPVFEGPLDLLLHLIQKHELDILDLPIAFVTERYLDYLALMRRLNLDVASEYLVMAATLAHIKSKMLLPTVPEDQDEEELDDQPDPREELIRRLLEYQKYKSAAEDLGSRQVAGRDVFLRGTPGPKAQGPAPLAQVGLFSLLDAFQGVLKRAQGNLALEVSAERISIQDRISQLTELLQTRRRCRFEELFDSVITRYDVVVTFLALLEMAKMRVARLYQADPHAPVYVQSGLLGEEADASEPLPETSAGEPSLASPESDPTHAAEATGHPDVAEQARASDDGMPPPPSIPASEERPSDAVALPAAEATHEPSVPTEPSTTTVSQHTTASDHAEAPRQEEAFPAQSPREDAPGAEAAKEAQTPPGFAHPDPPARNPTEPPQGAVERDEPQSSSDALRTDDATDENEP